MQGFWNKLKAQWYRKGLDYSTLGQKSLAIILPKSKDIRTFLDAGSGCGTLSIPLAKAGKVVTALDPSHNMINILKEDIKKQRLEKKIKTVQAAWGEEKIKTHDAVICANVPQLLKNPEFLKDADKLAKKAVFLIESVDPRSDKFYYRDLYPLIFNKEFGEKDDYLSTYERLHSMGIFANVEVFEYDFDQPFDDMDEAIEFWKEYLGIVTEEHDKKLRDYLGKKLVKRKGGGLLAKFHKRSAVMWWRKGPGRKSSRA